MVLKLPAVRTLHPLHLTDPGRVKRVRGHTSETLPGHFQDTFEALPRHSRGTSEALSGHFRDTFEYTLQTPTRHVRDTSETLRTGEREETPFTGLALTQLVVHQAGERYESLTGERARLWLALVVNNSSV